MLYEIFADCSLAALLVVAIAYCRKLDGKLRRMRRGEASMLEAAERLNHAVAEARRALASLDAVAARRDRGVHLHPLATTGTTAPADRALRRRLG